MVCSPWARCKIGPSLVAGEAGVKRESFFVGSLNIAGSWPRSPPYSFVTPQKSKQKRAPGLLARHKVASILRSNGSHRAFAIRSAQLSGLIRREPSLLRQRHTVKG